MKGPLEVLIDVELKFSLYFNSKLHDTLEELRNYIDQSLDVEGELGELSWPFYCRYYHEFPFNFYINSLINFKSLE